MKAKWLQTTDFIPGLLLTMALTLPAHLLGQHFPLIGGPIIALVLGLIISTLWSPRANYATGIQFASRFILQAAVVFLGFGLNLTSVVQQGIRTLPVILSTIVTGLVVGFVVARQLSIPHRTATLIGIGSAICGGSAIAAAAPIIESSDEEVAHAISVIFFFNLIAALLFPWLAIWMGMTGENTNAFGIFAGSAINDTSSVTAASAVWDSMWGTGTQTLDYAVTVKLTRTLAIIPITLVLAYLKKHKRKHTDEHHLSHSWTKIVPPYILFFIAASLLTTLAMSFGAGAHHFAPFKATGKFFITTAMAAIGLNANAKKLIKGGVKPFLLGLTCSLSILIVCLVTMKVMSLW